MIATVFAKAGVTDVKAGTRRLRHNAATRLLRASVPLPTISAVLGHADPESTDLYLSVDQDRLLECVLDVPNRKPVMNAAGFTSEFAPQLEAYLAFKQKMGFYGASRIWYLKQFDAYCTAHGRTVFDRDTVEGWVSAQLARSGRYRSWMSYIRDVGRWLQAHGQRDAYVLSDRWKAQRLPAHPYLLSRDEIESFFAAAATLNTTSPWRWQAVAFFTLMHCSGCGAGSPPASPRAHTPSRPNP